MVLENISSMIWDSDIPYQGTTVIKNNKFCHLQQWMNGTEIYYAKWNKSYRERQMLYDITYIWNLNNKAS